jgi:hypothetical protein
MNTFQDDIKELEDEIEQLKIKLTRAHFVRSNEQDYDIKSKIIEKQNKLIEILIKENENFLNLRRHN